VRARSSYTMARYSPPVITGCESDGSRWCNRIMLSYSLPRRRPSWSDALSGPICIAKNVMMQTYVVPLTEMRDMIPAPHSSR
jgi:hypothetical protein